MNHYVKCPHCGKSIDVSTIQELEKLAPDIWDASICPDCLAKRAYMRIGYSIIDGLQAGIKGEELKLEAPSKTRSPNELIQMLKDHGIDISVDGNYFLPDGAYTLLFIKKVNGKKWCRIKQIPVHTIEQIRNIGASFEKAVLEVIDEYEKKGEKSMREELRWIPVSECLPEEGQEVLVTVWEDSSYGKGTDISTSVDMATYHIGGGYIPVDDEYSPEGGYFDTFNDWVEGQPCKITAWMPLPKPYQDEKE